MNLIIAPLVQTLAKVVKYSVTASISLALVGQVVDISLKYYSYKVSTEVYFGSPRYPAYPTLWVGHLKYQSVREYGYESALAKFNYLFTTDTDTVSTNRQHEPLYFMQLNKIYTCWKFSQAKETYTAAKKMLYSIYEKEDVASLTYLAMVWHTQPYFRFRLKSPSPNVLSPEIFNISRLAAPYPSRCINFNLEECKMKCTFAAVSRFNCTLYIYPQVRSPSNYCSYEVTRTANIQCMEKCEQRKECLEIQYNLKKTSEPIQRVLSRGDLRRINTTSIDLLSPENELAITEVASLTMTSFIIYISGLFGLWFGTNLNTLKQLIVNKLQGRRHVETVVSSVFVIMTLAHCTYEMMAYFEYPTSTLTTYETEDELDGPQLCIKQTRTFRTAGDYSAIELNRLYLGDALENLAIASSQEHRMRYDTTNISKLSWYEMVDYYSKTSCLGIIESVLYSRKLGMIYPENQIIVLEYRHRSRIYSQLSMTSKFPGSGSDHLSQYYPVEPGKCKFHVVRLKLLPAPYSTSCYNYPKTGESCLNKCLRETSYRIDKRLYNSAKTYINDTRLFSVDKIPNTDIKHICFNACKRPNCVIVGYKRNPMRFVGPSTERIFTQIHLNDDVMSSTFYPVQTLYDHVIILFGLLGLWLGFSVLGMVSLVESAKELLKVRKLRQNPVKRRLRAWIR
ncbi:hypothetical protein HDE_06976 [Halotydeus destructor]|nr:hypothetical protein HDE_06976 [Halotydeus destructor]